MKIGENTFKTFNRTAAKKITVIILGLLLVITSVFISLPMFAKAEAPEVAFGKISERGAADVENGECFGMYGSNFKQVAPRTSKESDSEFYTFFHPSNEQVTNMMDIQKTVKNAVDVSKIAASADNIAFAFWLYLPQDANVCLPGAGGELYVSDLSHAGSNWDQAYVSSLNSVIPNLKAGWSRISMSLGKSALRKTVDLSAIKYVRMYITPMDKTLVGGDTFRIGFNDARFIYTEQAEGVKVIETEGKQTFTDTQIIMDDTTSKTGWLGNMAVSDVNVPANVADASALIGDKGTQVLEKVYTAAFNAAAKGYNKHKIALDIYFYINNVALLDLPGVEGAIELGSGGANDVQSEKYNLKITLRPKLNNGWNHLVLNLAQNEVSPRINPESINYLRVYCVGEGLSELIMGISTVKIAESNAMEQYSVAPVATAGIDPSVVKDAENAASGLIKTISDTTSKALFDNIAVQYGKISEFDKPTGEKSALMLNPGYGGMFLSNFKWNFKNFKQDEIGLKLWIYINDVDYITADGVSAALVQATSNNAADGGCSTFDLLNEELTPQLVNGWNQIYLPFGNTSIDYKNVNYIRYVIDKPGGQPGMQIGICNITVSKVEGEQVARVLRTEENAVPDTDSSVTLISTANPKGWFSHAKGVYTGESPDGGKAILSSSPHHMITEVTFPSPIDITKSVNPKFAALSFWIYFNDVSYLTPIGNVEISSTKKLDDGNKYAWSWGEIAFRDGACTLQNGWNKLVLKLGSISPVGNVDLTALQYMRVFNLGEGGAPYPDGFNMVSLISDVKIIEMDLSTLPKNENVVQNVAFTGNAPTAADIMVIEADNGVSAGEGANVTNPYPETVVTGKGNGYKYNEDLSKIMIILSVVAMAVAVLGFGAVLVLKKTKIIK